MPGYVEAPAEVEPGWTYRDGRFAPPPEPEPPTLNELKPLKIAEIRAIALEKGRAGATIIGSVTPYLVYHMALTPDDVAYLKLANEVAKAEADALGIPLSATTAEIKEKWLEDGVEKTKLHPSVPLHVHDAVLLQAILQAKEITRRQELLIQAVHDTETPEAVHAIHWNM